MSPEQFCKKVEAVEALPLFIDKLRSIRDQPPLAPQQTPERSSEPAPQASQGFSWVGQAQ
jgi:hypothetical protein